MTCLAITPTPATSFLQRSNTFQGNKVQSRYNGLTRKHASCIRSLLFSQSDKSVSDHGKRERQEVNLSCRHSSSSGPYYSYLMLGFISFSSSSSSLSSTCCMTRSADPSSTISTYDLFSSSLKCHLESLSPSEGDIRCCSASKSMGRLSMPTSARHSLQSL